MSEQGVFVPSAWYFGGFLEFLSWRCLLKNIICSFSHSDCKCKTQILKMEKSWKYTEATVTKFKNSCTIQLLRENSCWHLRSWSKSFVCVCTPFIQGLWMWKIWETPCTFITSALFFTYYCSSQGSTVILSDYETRLYETNLLFRLRSSHVLNSIGTLWWICNQIIACDHADLG